MSKLVVFLGVIFSCLQLQAQDTPKVVKLNNVLVIGTRADNRTPVTQKTIGESELLGTYQGEEVPMLLSQFPSIYSNSDGGHAQGYTYFSLRGINQPRINMTLNGVPLNEPEDHGVYTSNFPCFINAIQSVQIQRGVGTSTNGTASFAGSISFQSKSGLVKSHEVQMGVGSYNTERINFSNSSGLNKNNFASFLNIGFVTTDGFRYNSGSKCGSLFYSLGHYGEKNVTKLTVFSGLSKNQMAWDGVDEKELEKDYRLNPRGNDNPDFFSQTHVQLHNATTINKNTRLTATVFYNYLTGHYDVYSSRDLAQIGYYAKEKQHSNWVGVISQLDYKTKNISYSVGVSANHYRRNHEGMEFSNTYPTYNYKNYGDKNDLSGFVKANVGTYDMRGYVDMQVRYATFNYVGDVPLNQQSWLFFNPKIGFKAFFSKNLSYYHSIGISHREPTRSVMFGGNLYLIDFKKFNPEEVLDIEMGMEYLGKTIKLQANIYSMIFKNEIIPAGPLGLNSLPTMINVPQSNRVGLEVDFEAQVDEDVSYQMNTTLSKSYFGDNQVPMLFSPTLMVKHGLTYTKNKLSVNVNNQIYSQSYIDFHNNTIPAYGIVGLNVSYKVKNATAILQVNNLTNSKYFCNGYVLNNTKYLYPNALANWYLTIKADL